MGDATTALGEFARRHIGPSAADQARMLEAVGAPTLDALIDQVIPERIRSHAGLDTPGPDTEEGCLRRLTELAAQNRVWRTYLGLGYADTITPSVILRMVMENPGWYTPYTPYQAEIAQGRLESLINFQTMVSDLTGMEVANASLLDEGTAAAEAMALLHRVQPATPGGASGGKPRRTFRVSDGVYAQTIDVLRSRAEPLDFEIVVAPLDRLEVDAGTFGVMLQYPDDRGRVVDLRPHIDRARAAGAGVAVATDLLALTLLTPPGEMGADVVVGNSQRFGVPLGYGGPHAAFFATRQAYVRHAPGRIIGASVDVHGRTAFRMALATREQHIRREKATSNICTAQALLANMAAMYAVYHGPDGLRGIANRIHEQARTLEAAVTQAGLRQLNDVFFDTLLVEVPAGVTAVRERAESAGINLRYVDGRHVAIALHERVTDEDVADLAEVLTGSRSTALRASGPAGEGGPGGIPASLTRTSAYLTHPTFNTHRSETQMMRYIRHLERKDLGLDTAMIPLGSCTMKLNAATEMLPVTWDGFSRLHPLVPVEQAQGYAALVKELEASLCAITGFAAISLQPNSGAQGEFAGLLVVRAYHRSRGQAERDVVLIPASAHGTNPASAAMAGMTVVVVANASDGGVDMADLRAKAAKHAGRLACLMITYPSTHGVYEEQIQDVCALIHEHGGQVYMDGANMNAQVGLTSPAAIGADVCHLNLHKTFAIPHGGGGPGMGPIGVAAHLAPFLPRHGVVDAGGTAGIGAVSSAPWGSASILLISYAYTRLLGPLGLAEATRVAILNANYLKSRLEPHFPVLYAGARGRVAHELIFDLRGFKAHGIDEMDVAKRLIDYGFHAPTVSFPVAGTLMVEPTESESLDELDRFCEAMIRIRGEIEDVVTGRADRTDNVLKNAPHTAEAVAATTWTHPYSREAAAFPVHGLRHRKFWPSVGRVDNPYGDRNLFCACPPIETYS
jgi:glycine dehydrogenase